MPATTTTKTAQAQPEAVAARSQNFVLADMDGRAAADNRACGSCISNLSPTEVGQVNWHLTEDQQCRLCDVAAGKPEAFTKPFCDFLQENPTVFHTVDYFKRKLNHSGFTQVSLSTLATSNSAT